MSDIDSKVGSDGYKTVDDFNPPYACDGHRKVTTEIRAWANHISGAVGNPEYIKLVGMIDDIDEWIDGHGLSLEDGFGGDAEASSDEGPDAQADVSGDADAMPGEAAPAGDGDVPGADVPIPIVPMSNILLDVAAERIMGHSPYDSDDPLSRSIRAKRAIRDGIGWFAPKAVTEGLSTASSRAIFCMSHARDHMASVREIRKSGYSSGDVATLGPSLVRRFAQMLQEVSDTTSDGLMDDVAKVLARASSWHEHGYHDTASLLGHESAYETGVRLRREFDRAWDWVREHVFDLGNLPGEPRFRREFWTPEASSLATGDGIRGIVRGMGSVAHGDPTPTDLRAMPYAELARLSDMLREFAESTVSWPEVYPDHPQLCEIGDDWADRQYWDLLGGIRTNNAQGSRERITEVGDDGKEKVYYRAKTNRQMGLSFAAWTQDCYEAATVIGHWGRENAHEETAEDLRDIMTPEDRQEIEGRRKAAWQWLGRYAFCMTL